MPRKTTNRPTDAELAILGVLWRSGPCTVRQVQEVLESEGEGEPVGYTTVLKLLQIMTEKQLVVRDESERAHLYTARESATTTRRSLVSDLVERAFEGSSSQLVLQALAARPASPEELAEIRRVLETMTDSSDSDNPNPEGDRS